MSKTWYGHHIDTIKGEDYVLFKDYLELDKEIERLNNIIDELEKHFEMLKMNCDKGWEDFFEDIVLYIKKLKALKEGK